MTLKYNISNMCIFAVTCLYIFVAFAYAQRQLLACRIILLWFRTGLSNVAPVIYFPGALIYSAGFNINQNFKKKIFLNNSMFQFFS
jgi:hypothetical protein